MKTTDLRPYAAALLAAVYTIAFGVYWGDAPRDDGDGAVAQPDVAPRPTGALRIRTRSS